MFCFLKIPVDIVKIIKVKKPGETSQVNSNIKAVYSDSFDTSKFKKNGIKICENCALQSMNIEVEIVVEPRDLETPILELEIILDINFK